MVKAASASLTDEGVKQNKINKAGKVKQDLKTIQARAELLNVPLDVAQRG